MSVEELLEKYKGAYASDFEAASASGSKASSDSEVSGDEEEETEEDESDAESNTSSSGINQLKIISCKVFICSHSDKAKVSQLFSREIFPSPCFLKIVCCFQYTLLNVYY